MKRIRNENMATAPKTINREQENVIKKLEEALNTLRQIEIKNEDSFDIVNEPLDDFLSKLKYLPTNPSFDILPTEIKTDIFSYLCDSGAFVAASVCYEWKEIIETRLKKVDGVEIGLHCSNEYECEDKECCFMPEEILKASIALKSDVPLSLCRPIPWVDSQLIAEGLASASSLIIKGKCDCATCGEDDEDDEDDEDEPTLTENQFKRLFEALERKSDVMTSLKLLNLDLTFLPQNSLTDFLLSITRSLTLDEGQFGTIFNVKKFVRKLSRVPDGSHELRELKIHHLDYSESPYRMADALCNVFTVQLYPEFTLKMATIRRLFHNILNQIFITRPIMIKNLAIYANIDYRTLIDPDVLKTLLGMMRMISLTGTFTPEQVEAVRFLPGVEASLDRIYKKPITELETADLDPTEEQQEGGDVEVKAEDGKLIIDRQVSFFCKFDNILIWKCDSYFLYCQGITVYRC